MEDIDVLYIHPSKFLRKTDYSYIPMGAIAIENLLNSNGTKCYGVNYALELSIDSRFSLESLLKSCHPEIVLIDLHWYEHCYSAVEIARMSKMINPSSYVALGGLTATYFDQEILRDYPFIDFILRGDAEFPILELVNSIRKGTKLSKCPNLSYRNENELIKRNTITYVATTRDLDNLNFVDIQFLKNWEKYYKTSISGFDETRTINSYWLCIGRGCLFNCSYCGGSKVAHELICKRKTLVWRSVQKVLNDIFALSDFGIRQVLLSHDLAMTPKKYWRYLFSEIRRERLDIGALNQCWILPPREFVKDFAKTFVPSLSMIELTPETGDENVRYFNFSDKFYSNDEFFRCLKYLDQEDLPLYLYISTNLPKETIETFRQTTALCKRAADIYKDELLTLFCGTLTLEPCSPMYMNPDAYFIIPELKRFKDYYAHNQLDKETPGYKTEFLSDGNIARMANEWEGEMRGILKKPNINLFI